MRHWEICVNDPEQETCTTKDFPKGIVLGVVTAAALVIILLTALFLFLKKKPYLDAREPVDSKHTQGQDEDKYDQKGEEYYITTKTIMIREERTITIKESSTIMTKEGSYYY